MQGILFSMVAFLPLCDAFAQQYVRDRAEHEDAPFHAPTILYSSTLWPEEEETPLLSVDVVEVPMTVWREEQGFRLMSEVGTQILLRRRFHETDMGVIIEDIMMERVETENRWNNLHVLYHSREPSPFPAPTKKRKEPEC